MFANYCKLASSQSTCKFYCRHEEMKHELIPIYWKELSNILWMCIHVLNVLVIYTGTLKSDNVYKRHAAFGKRYELLMTSVAVMKKQKLKNHWAPAYHICLYAKYLLTHRSSTTHFSCSAIRTTAWSALCYFKVLVGIYFTGHSSLIESALNNNSWSKTVIH